jgi:NAD(P)-dependent dehydrogenase (short-subunit alcohol dehydrogenase family)
MQGTLFDSTGRVVLVTGGSKGLGLAMARGFAEAGADVVISSRHQDELDRALVEITDGLDVRGLAIESDMTNREDVKRLAETAVSEMGRVDVLINNAGSNVPEQIDSITDENWDRIIELNLTSCMALTRELVPGMKERGWGRVIHISSIMGLVSKEGRNAYSATKSGLLGLTRASALDLGEHGITVNSICPGPFLTDLPMSVLSEEQMEFFATRTALGRWGECQELVGTALLLGTEAGSYITGTSITVDGGTVIKSF